MYVYLNDAAERLRMSRDTEGVRVALDMSEEPAVWHNEQLVSAPVPGLEKGEIGQQSEKNVVDLPLLRSELGFDQEADVLTAAFWRGELLIISFDNPDIAKSIFRHNQTIAFCDGRGHLK